MIEFLCKYRISLTEIDQTGYTHHSNYAKYCEYARFELFRSLGIPYKQLDDKGYMLVINDLSLKNIKPTKYDDQLTIRTTLKSIESPNLSFSHLIFDKNGELVCQSDAVLSFAEKANCKTCLIPDCIFDAFCDAIPEESEY